MTDYKDIKYDFSGENLTDISLNPTVSSITPTSTTVGALPLGSVVIAGTNFTATSTVTLISASGTSITCPSVVFNSSIQLTVTIPAGVGGQDEDPWDVSVENPILGQGDNLFTIDDNPVFTTAAGTLGTILDTTRTAPLYTLSAATATDPEGVTVSYSLVSPGPAVSPGLSFDATNAAITGDADAVSGDTTTTFTVRATAGAQTADREFSILVKEPVKTYFTTAGAATEVIDFTAAIKILVVGGGGSGTDSGHAGGGGGGGLIVHPSYSATPQTYGYYIGSGGQAAATAAPGENSNWGVNTEPASTTSTILTGLGGGLGSGAPASDGGSGGGRSHSTGAGGATLQANSPLISADAKTYGFGSAGGLAPYSGPYHPSGGGGGAGAAGQAGQGGSTGGAGGAGKDVSTDFGTAQGSPGGHFAGGGGGGCFSGGTGGNGANGGGNGAGTGLAGPGNAGTAITGGGGGSGAAGGNGVIAIAY